MAVKMRAIQFLLATALLLWPIACEDDTGESCDAGDDCSSGVCEGLGCGPGEGRCAPAGARTCTADAQNFWGCDGQTFVSSGSCPGRRYAYLGVCAEE